MDLEEEISRYERWKQSTKALLSAVRKETCQPYSIPVVPDNLRKWNETAYIPKVVSIGPQYRGKEGAITSGRDQMALRHHSS